MRVLFVTHNIPRHAGDAAGSFVLRLARALRDRDIDVEIVAPGLPDRVGVDVVDGIRIHRVRYASPARMTLAYEGTMADTARASLGGMWAFLGLFRALRRATVTLARSARREGRPIDIVHAHWWIPAGVAVWLARLGAPALPPMVITMHGSDVRLAQGIRASHAIMRVVLRNAAVVVAVSDWLARTASRLAGGQVVEVGPMPVDVTRFTPDPAAARRDTVLFVGRLNRQKGVADLLDAVATMSCTDATLDIVGEGPDGDTLRARAESLGIAHRVTWHGNVPPDALLPLYRRARIVAMPSREEGLGLVAVEAQLCETPVVGYASGGLPDVVLPHEGGALVAVGDIAALARELDGAMQHPARARDRGRAGREAMLERFSPETVALRYARWYEQAMGGVGAGRAAAIRGDPSGSRVADA